MQQTRYKCKTRAYTDIVFYEKDTKTNYFVVKNDNFLIICKIISIWPPKWLHSVISAIYTTYQSKILIIEMWITVLSF